MKSRITATCTLALLTACTTVGHPYPFPKDPEPSAQLQIQGTDVYLLTLNEKGCYMGKTEIDGGPGAMPVKVVPDKPLLISYEKNACLLTATFSPKKDAHYWLVATEGRKPLDPDASFFGSLMHVRDRQCDVGVAELDNEGHPLTPVKMTTLSPRQTGMTCIRFQ